MFRVVRKLGRLLPILAVLCLALLLRVYRLSELPPGFHYDEGANALLTELLLDSRRPVAIFPAYAGRESFIFYFFAASFWTLGHSVWSLRLPVALLGVLAVAGVHRLTWELLWTWPVERRRWAAAGAALFLATSPWHVVLTRDAFRASTVGLVGALFLAAWVRAWREGARRALGAYAIAGLLLGLLAYTYSAVRVLPLAVLALAGWVVWRRGRAALVGMAAMGVVAFVVVAPLVWALWRMPEHLTLRAGQTSVFGEKWTSGPVSEELRQSALAAAGMLFVRGDPTPRFNAWAAPIWDPVEAVLAGVGLVLLLRPLRKRRASMPVRPGAVVLVWGAVASLPVLLSADVRPTFVRSVGLLPLVFVPPGVGLAWLAWRLRSSWARAGLVGLVAAGALVHVSTLYFHDWAGDPATHFDYQGPETIVARLAREEVEAGHTVLVAARDYRNPAMAFLLGGADRVRWFDGTWSLPAPGEPSEVSYLAATADLSRRWREVLDGAAHQRAAVRTAWGGEVARLWRVRPEALGVSRAVERSLNGELGLLAAYLDGEAPRGRSLEVAVDLTVLRSAGERALAVHLVDREGFSRGQVDNLGYPAGEWRAGDRFLQRWELPVGADIPPGRYEVRLSMTDGGGRLLPTLDADGRQVGVAIGLREVRIRSEGGLVLPVQGTEVAPGLRVIEASVLATEVVPGDTLGLRVRWQRGEGPAAREPLRVMLGEESWSVEPVEGYPVEEWREGEVLETRHRLPVPIDAAPGEHEVRLGRNVVVGRVRVAEVPIVLQEPEVPQRVEARLGGFARLLGWEVSEAGTGEPLTLTLYWQALEPADQPYKVFTHLLDVTGRLVAQHDSVPVGGARPTTGWREGEYLVDPYTLVPPASGEFTVEVGMYHPETLERVEVELGDGSRPVERRVVLGTLVVRSR